MNSPVTGEYAVKASPTSFLPEMPYALGASVAAGGSTSGLPFFDVSEGLPAEEARELAMASLANLQQVMQIIRRWQNLGYNLEDIYLSGVASAARLLGGWWLSDEISFSEVTIGSLQLEQSLRELSPEFLKNATRETDAKRILLLTPPGSQHALGSHMTAEFFRRAGWHVTRMDARDEASVLRVLYTDRYDLAGFSIASDRQVEILTTLIQKIRSVSVNADIRIMVGGPMASLNRKIVQELGADCCCQDVRTALAMANQKIENCKSYH